MADAGARRSWDAATLYAILDALPAPTLVVDADARVLFVNEGGRALLGIRADDADLGGPGDVLGCVNARATTEGCGFNPGCKRCILRATVRRALDGEAVTRARIFLEIEGRAGRAEAHFLVSAAPVHPGATDLAIVTLEDLSEFVLLTSLLPICFHCRKVRDEQDYWTTVEEYFKSKADIDFTHTLCRECLEKHYPGAE